jgi:protocatechuate 3,4-dioxygenase, beta subunit
VTYHKALMTRRNALRGGLAAAGAMAFFSSGAFAEQLARTPAIEEGPFYPHKMPLDTDNDLIIINDSLTPAVGEIAHLGGRILDAGGSPIRNAVVEIWQCDAKGSYIASENDTVRDNNFQGYGRFLTGSSGEYYFRTIKPVPYSGRPAPHVHFKVRKGRTELLTTQMFIAGFPGNARDGIYRGIRNPVDRELASVDFKPLKDSKIGEVSAQFDVVVGRTPADSDDDHH